MEGYDWRFEFEALNWVVSDGEELEGNIGTGLMCSIGEKMVAPLVEIWKIRERGLSQEV